MNIHLNNKEFSKEELLRLIKKSKIQAIVFIKSTVKISLKDAKDIIDNLDNNPNYYDNTTIKKKTAKEFVENEQINVDAKSAAHKKASPNGEKKRGSHFIKTSNPSRIFFIIGLFSLIIITIYLLTK